MYSIQPVLDSKGQILARFQVQAFSHTIFDADNQVGLQKTSLQGRCQLTFFQHIRSNPDECIAERAHRPVLQLPDRFDDR
jgi:hypothetical protein